jgi:hypothetical protein
MFTACGLLQDYPGWVAKNYSLFQEHPRLRWFFSGLFFFTLLYVVSSILGWIRTVFDGAVFILLGFSAVIFIFSIDPTWFRRFWDLISLRMPTKTATIKTVIESGFWNSYEGEKILADIVVFGHTHIADDSKDRYNTSKDYNKRFINSGSWGDDTMKTSDGQGESEKNTFVYIDKEGPILFRWPDKGPVPEQIRTTLTGDSKEPVRRPSPILLWIWRNIWDGG